VISTARKRRVRFSITVRQDRKVRAAIEAIGDDAWVPIPYWLSTPEVSGADVAETSYTCFAGTKDAIEVRLIVRRVRPTPSSQLTLFTDWDYHAFVTDRDSEMLELEADHRRHAVVEQSIAELKSAGWAHAPSGRFFANAAWTSLAAMGTTSLARSARWPAPTWPAPPWPPCGAGYSPLPAGWCAPPGARGCVCPVAGPGRQRS
jgi:hypothetical protein